MEHWLAYYEEFAKRYAAELFNRKGFASRRAQYELLQKGIDKEMIAKVVERIRTGSGRKDKGNYRKKYLRICRMKKDIDGQ